MSTTYGRRSIANSGTKMVRLSTWLALTILLLGLASAKDVPFAVAPVLRPSNNNAYVPSLSEIMQIVQLKHIKIWQAGSSMNWRLASFEVDQIRDTFLRTAIFYEGIPANYAVAVNTPLNEMKTASEARDRRGYDAGYSKLTKACNACHEAAHVGFIIIITPTVSPFSDQKF